MKDHDTVYILQALSPATSAWISHETHVPSCVGAWLHAGGCEHINKSLYTQTLTTTENSELV